MRLSTFTFTSGLLSLLLVPAHAGPVRNTQSVTLMEHWPHGGDKEWTQRLIYIDRTSDARAVVCMKNHLVGEAYSKNGASITCWYAMNSGTEVIVAPELLRDESAT